MKSDRKEEGRSLFVAALVIVVAFTASLFWFLGIISYHIALNGFDL